MKTGSFKTYKGPGRIAIARFAPRGMAAGYRIFKDLAPGPWFNSVTRPVYEKKFAEEVLAKLNPQETWDKLHELAAGAEPVLLCYEEPPFDPPGSSGKNWCHRRMVARWFEEKLGQLVHEIEFDLVTKAPRLGDYSPGARAAHERQASLF